MRLLASTCALILLTCASSNRFRINSIADEYSRNSSTHSNTVALILARGGSKGVPLKNLERINGLTLLARSLIIIKNSNAFGDIWVSTDHHLIGFEASRYGANVHYRPAHLSADHTTSIESVQEFLRTHPNVESVALIQCTAVFLRESYLRLAAYRFRASDCVFSVVRSFKLRWKSLSNGRLVPLNFAPNERPRRQDLNGELLEAGMFYVARRSLLLEGFFQNDRCQYVEIDSMDALEIDTPSDLRLARLIILQSE